MIDRIHPNLALDYRRLGKSQLLCSIVFSEDGQPIASCFTEWAEDDVMRSFGLYFCNHPFDRGKLNEWMDFWDKATMETVSDWACDLDGVYSIGK